METEFFLRNCGNFCCKQCNNWHVLVGLQSLLLGRLIMDCVQDLFNKPFLLGYYYTFMRQKEFSLVISCHTVLHTYSALIFAIFFIWIPRQVLKNNFFHICNNQIGETKIKVYEDIFSFIPICIKPDQEKYNEHRIVVYDWWKHYRPK